MLPDLTIVALLSVIRAYYKKESISYIILGGFAFATLYCIHASILTGGGYLSTTSMMLGLAYNLFLILGNKVFKTSKSCNNWLNGSKTIVQIICVWTITLVAFPILIQMSFCLPTVITETNYKFGIGLLLLSSLLGLSSALYMVNYGKGTPLPLDQTQQLVISGPYKYVRNPMAVAGLGQGIAVSILLGSIHVLAYFILGTILWQFVVRPLEEKNMSERFGEAYEQYKAKVPCWFPKINQGV